MEGKGGVWTVKVAVWRERWGGEGKGGVGRVKVGCGG